MSNKTESEKIFEAFCNLNQITCEEIVASSIQQSPDYKIQLLGQDIIVEIKQFDPNDEEKETIRKRQQGESLAFGTIPGDRIRGAIHTSNKQFKRRFDGKTPSLLVVYDNVMPPSTSHTRGYCVMVAMKGFDKVEVLLSKDPKKTPIFGETVSGSNREMRLDANTTISAIAVLLLHGDDSIGLNVYHNQFAKIPVDPALLRINNVRQFKLPENSQNSLDKSWEELLM